MCGIAGSLRTPPGPSPVGAERFSAPLAHRGPDSHGAWEDPESGVLLAHRRLAILDLSPLGHQPMASACGRFVAAYNGEIYNFLELRRELEGLGHAFRGRSDTEVMLAAFTRWGVRAALPRLNGMFAAGVWDRRERLLHLFRDRAGEKPLYYGWCGPSFLFASELKALRAHPDFRGEIDRAALALYFRHDYIPAPRTVYRGIFKLPAGTHLEVRPGARPEPWWSAPKAEPVDLPERELVDRLEALLKDAVRLRMLADVPVGAFLSGGIDSSLVVALMQAAGPRPARTFTIGFREAGYDEARDAKEVARHLGTDHTELYVTPEEARDVIPLLPELYDEPFADSSQIPTYLVSKLARRHVTVALSGDAGDELFGGYTRYGLGRRIWEKLAVVPRPLRGAAGRAMGAVPASLWNGLYRAGRGLLPDRYTRRPWGEILPKLAGVLGTSGPERMYRDMVSHWKLEEGLVLGAPAGIADGFGGFEASGDFTAWMMLTDFLTYLPDDILVKVDRASMGVSLEARVPYLDPRVIEFAMRLPMGLKVRGGRSKWILREVLDRHVPRSLVERPKMGFGVPVGAWLRGPLRGWAEDLLAERRLRDEGWLRPDLVRTRWEEHLSGRRDWQHHLWDVLMFEGWLRENEKQEVRSKE